MCASALGHRASPPAPFTLALALALALALLRHLPPDSAAPSAPSCSAERAVVELEKRERAEVKAAAKAAGKADTAQYEEDMRLQRDAAREVAVSERAEWSAMRADRVERHLSDLEAASEGWVGVNTEVIEAAIDAALDETTEWGAWQMAEEDHLSMEDARRVVE